MIIQLIHLVDRETWLGLLALIWLVLPTSNKAITMGAVSQSTNQVYNGVNIVTDRIYDLEAVLTDE